MFSVYILFSTKLNRYYVGYTNNMQRRISEHNRKKGKYTDAGIPWVVVYSEQFQTRRAAMGREAFIKSKKPVDFIESLIKSQGR